MSELNLDNFNKILSEALNKKDLESYEESYQQGKKDGAREFAEWLYTSHINIDSNTIDMQIWVDHWLRKYEKDRKNDGGKKMTKKCKNCKHYNYGICDVVGVLVLGNRKVESSDEGPTFGKIWCDCWERREKGEEK